MTLNEKKQLTNYIKGLVRESINEMPLPDGFFQGAKDLPGDPVLKDFDNGTSKVLRIVKDNYPDGVIALNPEAEKGSPNRKVEIPADAIKIWKEDIIAISQADYNKYCKSGEMGGEEPEEVNESMNVLKNYIRGLVRESIGEMDSMPSWWNEKYGDEKPNMDDFDDEDIDFEKLSDEESDGETVDDEDDIAGINELRRLAESMARDAVSNILMEKKGGWKSKSKKKSGGKKGSKKGGEKKKSSSEKTLMDRLNSDGVNAAHYYYKLYGAKTDAEKAAARSLGYKKSKAEKTPDKKSHYRFTPKERNKLNAMLTTDNV